MNPLVPTLLDGVFMSVLAIGFVLAIVAFVSLMLTRGTSALVVILWAVAIFAVPFLGSGAWFAVRSHVYSKNRSRRPTNVSR
jgi:hypothetical protein